MVYINIYNYIHYVHIFMCIKMGHSTCLPFISLSPFTLLSLPPWFPSARDQPQGLVHVLQAQHNIPQTHSAFIRISSKFLG